MLDLSPEKLMVLLAIALMVLGPNRLPEAARTLARGLARVRQLTATVSDPIRANLAEPTRVMNEAMADVRDSMRTPAPPSPPVDPNLN
jgi:Sec-independent protein translocase protein TatA